MADTFYRASLGAKGPEDITVGAASGGTTVELRVFDTATGLTGNKTELLKAINAIRRYIVKADAPA